MQVFSFWNNIVHLFYLKLNTTPSSASRCWNAQIRPPGRCNHIHAIKNLSESLSCTSSINLVTIPNNNNNLCIRHVGRLIVWHNYCHQHRNSDKVIILTPWHWCWPEGDDEEEESWGSQWISQNKGAILYCNFLELKHPQPKWIMSPCGGGCYRSMILLIMSHRMAIKCHDDATHDIVNKKQRFLLLFRNPKFPCGLHEFSIIYPLNGTQ